MHWAKGRGGATVKVKKASGIFERAGEFCRLIPSS